MEVTGGDTEVRPGAEEEDSTLGSEPLLSTVWDSPSDMLERMRWPAVFERSRGGQSELERFYPKNLKGG